MSIKSREKQAAKKRSKNCTHRNANSNNESNSVNRARIAPAILLYLTTVAALFSGLRGQWHDWWVQWILIPALLLLAGLAVYEFFVVKFNVSRFRSIFASISSIFLLGIGVMSFYILNNEDWMPPKIQEGVTKIIVEFGNCVLPEVSINDPILRKAYYPFIKNGIPVGFYVKNNRLYIESDIFTGKEIIHLRRSNLNQNALPPFWDFQARDTAFEIVDERTNPIIQIFYRKPQEVIVYGRFLNEDGTVCTLNEMGMQIPPNPKQNAPIGENLKPMFKYPSALHKGEYVDGWVPPHPMDAQEYIKKAYESAPSNSTLIFESGGRTGPTILRK